MLDVEAKHLATALIKPKKVGVRMVGLKTMKSMKLMLKIADAPNLAIMMLIKMSLGELSNQTKYSMINPAADNALIK